MKHYRSALEIVFKTYEASGFEIEQVHVDKIQANRTTVTRRWQNCSF